MGAAEAILARFGGYISWALDRLCALYHAPPRKHGTSHAQVFVERARRTVFGDACATMGVLYRLLGQTMYLVTTRILLN